MSQEPWKHDPKNPGCTCRSCASVPPNGPADKLIPTRIHYVCPHGTHNESCFTDNYRDSRQDIVRCFKCHKSWKPTTFSKNSPHYGQEEPNPNPERYYQTECLKHGINSCKKCEKEELYSE